ncbi:MAG: CNNM domain-containing protein [ANME-2 cluster archaeon]|nr:CNNM domain-containing protein [ANME-2 cluster archaeon]
MIDLISLIELTIIIILISLSAFFSSSETAFIGVNRIKMLHLAEKGDKHAKIIHEELQHPEKFITTILVGNNVVNVAASVLVTVLVLRYFGNVGVAIATGVMTVVILVFGEIVPKTYATKHADTHALRIAGLLLVLTRLLYPLILVFTEVTNIILHILGVKETIKNPFITEDQIRLLLKVGVEEGVIKHQDRHYIQNVLDFSDEKAKTAMTYKSHMITVENTETLSEALVKINESGHSRLPVWRGHFDNITGMIFAKDLLKYRDKELETKTVEEILRPILLVKKERKIASIFRELQSKNVQIAVVVDESEKVVGLLSIEDILEEIVGEILDEYDIEEMSNGILPKPANNK